MSHPKDNGVSGQTDRQAYDAFVASLTDLDTALDEIVWHLLEVRARMAKIRRLHSDGRPLGDLRECRGQSLVQLLSEINTRLDTCGAHVRRHAVKALVEEGFSVIDIAAMFDVSRQRVATILKESEEKTELVQPSTIV